VEDLVQMRSELLGRPLAAAEREELVREYADQEILIREAVAHGLHLNDPRVRKRLTDKMNFQLSEEPPEPTAADLQALYDADPGRYRTPRSTSFEHIFFTRDKAAAEVLMARIRAGEEPADDAGNKFWLGRRMRQYTAGQLLTLLGYKFEQALRTLPVGEWRGPVQSGRGWHLVRVSARHEPEDLPEPERLRRLRADWDAQHRERSRERRMVELRSHYEVVLPEPAVSGPAQ
jgi:peptidyl-prolyl cis-trans isomerase C